MFFFSFWFSTMTNSLFCASNCFDWCFYRVKKIHWIRSKNRVVWAVNVSKQKWDLWPKLTHEFHIPAIVTSWKKNKSWKNRAMLTFSFFCIVVFKKSESWTFPCSVNNHYSLIWCFAWRMTTINLWVVPDKSNINFFPTYNFPICNCNWCEKCEQCEITFFRYAV
jgi:hypothetical protein